MVYEKVVTVYDNRAHADKAVAILKAAGYDDISVFDQTTLEAHDADDMEVREPGLWRRLFGRTVLDHEATVYGRTVENGGVVVTVRVALADVPRVMGLLETHNPVDVLKRAATVGALPATLVAKAAAGASMAAAAGAGTSTVSSAPISATAKAVAATATPSVSDVIRLAEEQLNVGKRLVQEGSTRIRRFVTERPVEASVTLHQEHTNVLRRAITDPGYIADVDWSDKVIEVKESAEQAVVSKNSRIIEEVVVRKEGTERVETIKDKVRKQELEVERLDRDGKKRT